MPQFWLATYALDPAITVSGSTSEPLMSAETRALAIEVIRDGDTVAVLFSGVDDPHNPENLDCRIGFCNDTDECNDWRDKGFPLVEASIDCAGDKISVVSPYFADAQDSMEYGSLLISISGVSFQAYPGAPNEWTPSYRQFQQSPDFNDPANYVRRKPIRWIPPRSNVVKLEASQKVELSVTASRCPSLHPFATSAPRFASAWAGELRVDVDPAPLPRTMPDRVSRVDTFGVPAFRFEDVEAIGFRLDLDGPDVDDALAKLVEPLNFHLTRPRTDSWAPDFRYRPATRTVLIELIRYGRMKLQTQDPPLTLLDFQSQHELVVRVLVGRVDDDSRQARAPAVYVPAIFVDNPWSKILGRDVQGFEKSMAEFCAIREQDIEPLRPNGCFRGMDKPEALGNVSYVKLPRGRRLREDRERHILMAECAPDRYANWDDLQQIDLGLALGRFSLVDTRWRQSDFDEAEFRRSFAREAMRENLNGFHSIQVAPVGERGFDRTWITAKFALDNYIRVVYPTGSAHLTLQSHPCAPAGWKNWCKLLGIAEGGQDRFSFQTGSWYRMKFSMSMTVNNGLEWSDAQG